MWSGAPGSGEQEAVEGKQSRCLASETEQAQVCVVSSLCPDHCWPEQVKTWVLSSGRDSWSQQNAAERARRVNRAASGSLIAHRSVQASLQCGLSHLTCSSESHSVNPLMSNTVRYTHAGYLSNYPLDEHDILVYYNFHTWIQCKRSNLQRFVEKEGRILDLTRYQQKVLMNKSMKITYNDDNNMILIIINCITHV